MLSTAFVILLSFFLPQGAEPYLSEGSAYAEYRQADVTFLVFDDDLALQAQAEFRETLAKPETARASVTVAAITENVIAGREALTIDGSKPAAVAKLDADGKVVVVKGVERTRQTYFDLGEQHLVLTVWSKVDEVDVKAISGEFADQLLGGEGETVEVPSFLINGVPIEEIATTFTSDILGEPLRVDVNTGRRGPCWSHAETALPGGVQISSQPCR